MKHIYSKVKIEYKFRHPECARPRALRSHNKVVFGMDMTPTIAGTVRDGQTHLIFAVYVCVDTVLVTYNLAHRCALPVASPIPLACLERPSLFLLHKNDQKPSPSPSVSKLLALGCASSGAVCPAELVVLQKLEPMYVGLNWFL